MGVLRITLDPRKADPVEARSPHLLPNSLAVFVARVSHCYVPPVLYRMLIPLVCSLSLATGCAHHTVFVEDGVEIALDAKTHDGGSPTRDPLPLTVAVAVRSFEAERLREPVFVQRLSARLRDASVFQGVMYPIPPGVEPIWELQLLVKDGGAEPDSNFWKGAIATALPPAAFFVWFQNDYRLETQALLVRNREVVRSYETRGVIRHRYQQYADKSAISSQGLDALFESLSRDLVQKLRADADTIQREDRARAGR